MLESIITSKTRLKLLIKFFVSASNNGHLRGLADEFEESTNAIRKELNQLTRAGYLQKAHQRNKIVYKANTAHPLFPPLQSLIRTHLGLDRIVEQILSRTGQVCQIKLVGDYAEGIDSGCIEVGLRGEQIDEHYVYQAAEKMGVLLGKEIKIYLNTVDMDRDGIILYARSQN